MKRSMIFFLLMIGLMMTGCSKQEETKEPVQNETNKKEEVEEVTFTSAFPLTGVATNDDVDQRAISVMVNNHTQARPQSGLSNADLVYEMLAEGNITRFLAVYQSEMPEQVGPIRSARNYYIDLAKGLNSLYIAHGYSPEAEQMLKSGYIDQLNGMQYDGTLFKRSSERKAPHNSYITFESIKKGATNKGYELTGAPTSFTFLSEEDIEGLSGDVVTKADINYGETAYNVQFTYNEQAEKYERYSNGTQTIDAETDKPILVDNVLIIETSHQVVDNKGRRDIDLQSGGNGYLLQKGKVNEVEWENKNGRIVPVLNGIEVRLSTGQNMDQYYPKSTRVD